MRKSIFLICLGLVLGTSISESLTVSSTCEEDPYSQFVTIEGTVRTVEAETGKIVIPIRQMIIFQRSDCKKCLHLAFTDADGNYKLQVGEGKYRVIVNETFLEGGSSLDPTQPEYVDARDKVRRNVFDLKLRRSKSTASVEIK